MQTLSESPVHHLHSRVLKLFLVCSVTYLALALRFAYLEVGPHTKNPEVRDRRTVQIPARRGDIFDRNGIPLAVSVDGFDVWVRPNLIRALKTKDSVVPALAGALDVAPPFIESKLDLVRPFVFVRRRVSRATGQAVQALHLQGVGADPVYLRTYPQGQIAAQVLGRVNTDGVGTAGLELGYDRELQGQDGLKQFRVDGKNEPIPGSDQVIRPVRNGVNLRLTLDARIQQAAEEQLSRAVRDHNATAGCTVVTDIQTGAILAIANRPTFNPNQPVKDMATLLNRAISYAYEPGSTMKMITAAGALSENAWNLTDTVECPGSMMIGRRKIRCVIEPPYHGGHGTETLRDIIRNSCNVGAATVGMKLGGAKLYSYINKFGLLDRSQLGLPGAVAYRLSSPDSWARVRLANIAFGQGVMITPLQLLNAYAAIGNKGVLMKPMLIGAVVDPETGHVRRQAPVRVRQVVSEFNAARVAEILKAVVYDGTGKPTQIPGYTVAGKTGSAQKAGGHGYLSGKYVASFVGFAPATHPRVACLTMIDEPQGLHWGAVCAAPVVREMLRWSLHYLQVPPDAPSLTADGASSQSVKQQQHRVPDLPGNPEDLRQLSRKGSSSSGHSLSHGEPQIDAGRGSDTQKGSNPPAGRMPGLYQEVISNQ